MTCRNLILALSIVLFTAGAKADEDPCQLFEDFIYFADHAATCNEAVLKEGYSALTTNYSCRRVDGLHKRMNKNGHDGINGMIKGGEDAVERCPRARVDLADAAFRNMLTWDRNRTLSTLNK